MPITVSTLTRLELEIERVKERLLPVIRDESEGQIAIANDRCHWPNNMARAALKRASMDLTRALADIRRS
jgi:hypothetical protein